MPAPATNDELTDVILKSGVIEDARLKAYLKKVAATEEGLPPDPGKLAGAMVRDGILTYFQAEQLLQGKWKRFFIGKYKVLERLGVGGMGQVFLCEHKLMKRRVAVKVLPAAKSQDEAALSRFYREARAVAAVDHPNIVRAYDIDQDDNLHFIVMEFVDGANFHDLVKRHGPMDILRACHYMYGSTVGLHHAHEMGLVHRDIKPANILVDRSGVVKILDMGLARFFHPEEDDMLTKKFDENVLGTADYLAPEQAIDSSSVDIRADIYGLGGTFYYMLTGFPPFPEGTVAQKLLWHQTKPPKSVRLLRPEVTEDLAAILDKMLAKDPAQRYQSPAELMNALAPFVQTPIPPPPDHEMPQLSAAASTGFATRTVGGPGSGAPLATSGSSRTAPTPAPVPQSAVPPAKASAKPVARPPSSFPAIPVAASHGCGSKPLVATLATPKPVAAEGPAVWESLTSETLANNLADTANTKKKPKVPPKSDGVALAPAEVVPKKKGSLLPWIIAASVGFLFVVALASVTVYYVTKKEKEEEPPPPVAKVARKWYVSSNGFGPDQQHTRKTLGEAIAVARTGDTISILDDRIEMGALKHVNAIKVSNLRIEAGNPSKNVVWVYKAPSPAGPKPSVVFTAALELTNFEDTVIENVTFELGGQIDVGIRVTGQFSGSTFQNLTIRGARKAGVQLVGVEAAEGRPFKLSKVRIVPEKSDKPYDTAVEITGAASNNIEISDCRLEGAGKGAALRIDANASNVVLRSNRIFNWDQGVLIAGAGDKAHALGLKLDSNTFHSMKLAGVSAEAGLTLPGRSVVVEKNLFVKSNEMFRAPGNSPAVKAEHNGKLESKEGGVPLKAEDATGFNQGSADPRKEDDFLRGNNGSRPTIGKDKIPVGFE